MKTNFGNRKSAAIVGAHGYSGLELARLLLKHPALELRACFARRAGWKLSDDLPEAAARPVPTLPLEELPSKASDYDAIFLATPAEASMEIIRSLPSGASCQIIDLSGAFRLEAQEFEEWYKTPHLTPDLIHEAVYGLVPWTSSAKVIQESRRNIPPRLIANPGCYATSVLMALLPVLKENLIDPDSIVIDAKSGTSGAGRKAEERLLFTELEGTYLPYRVGSHQHHPEICRYASQLGDTGIDPFFSTSLMPLRRGILSCIYSRTVAGATSGDIEKAYAKAYGDYPLVRIEKLGESAARDQAVLSVRKVVGTPRTHIGFHLSASRTDGGGKLYIFSSIDNLLKGAASQAIENWNISNGLKAEAGLEAIEGVL